MTNELLPRPALLGPASPSSLPLVNPASLVAAFLSGRNERTLRAYRQDLEDFRVFLGQETIEAAAALLLSQDQGRANALVFAYRANLAERGLSPATQNRRLAAIRSLVKLARMLGVVSFSLEVEGPRAEILRDTRGPGREGFLKLLGALGERRDKKAVRDRALLRLLFDLALRRGEVVSLDREHVDLENSSLLVLGKGRHHRQALPLPAPTAAALSAWLGVRGDGPGPLFPNLNYSSQGTRLSGTGLYLIIRALGRKVGLTVRPHGLRHAAITAALDKTGATCARCSASPAIRTSRR